MDCVLAVAYFEDSKDGADITAHLNLYTLSLSKDSHALRHDNDVQVLELAYTPFHSLGLSDARELIVCGGDKRLHRYRPERRKAEGVAANGFTFIEMMDAAVVKANTLPVVPLCVAVRTFR